MFAYRHAFHAGNHADVIKHAVLLDCLSRLQSKPGALTLIDTHGGAGAYSTDSGLTRNKAEYKTGLGRLWGMRLDKMPEMIANYIRVLRGLHGESTSLSTMAGSPLLMAQQMRPQDHLTAFEMHPTDAPLLKQNLARFGRRVQLRVSDGFAGLRGLLPPVSRRGLVLMDPSYEIRTDYGKALTSLREATSRFSTGCYVLWVPIVARLEVERLVRQALALPVEERLHLRFQVRRAGADGLGLMGSHLIVLNPPFGLQAACEEVMPWLVTQLGQDESAGCEIRLQEKKGGPKPPSLNNHQRVSRVDASRPLRGSSRDPSRG